MAARITPSSQAPVETHPYQLTDVTQEEVWQTLNRVLNSKHFANAPMKQKFLRLICDFHLNGRGAELNEYLIGREVFGRDDSYNPATDPIVRVGAHGVREKLALYYQREGASDEIRIEIPVGSYNPTFIRVGQAQRSRSAETLDTVNAPAVGAHSPGLTGAASPPNPIDAPKLVANEKDARAALVSRKWLVLMGIVVTALSVAVIALLVVNFSLREKVESQALALAKNGSFYGEVWAPFLKSADPTLLILSNPVVHRAVNSADPEVLTRKGVNLTPEQESALTSAAGGRLPVKRGQPLRLIPAFNMYTGIGEAIGVYRLSSLLQAAGEQTILKQSRSVGPEDLRDHDVILLGSVYSNQWSKPLSIKENFVYTADTTIKNLAPAPGEQREYGAVFDERAGNLLEDYALITVTPGVTGERMIMVLAGIYSEGTEAAAEFVTNPNYLNELNQRLRQLQGRAGTPKYYQALLKVRVENSFPTKVSLLTVRELQTGAQ
jgi:hypothetical protein